MNDIARIRSAEPVILGVLKILWDDGYEAVVDLRPVLAKGKIVAFINTQEVFPTVAIGEHGSSLYWTDAGGQAVDFGTVSLRERAERQAELIRMAS